MDDLNDVLQLPKELTDLLSRVRKAIEDYGEWTDWRERNFDQMLILSTVVQSIGISNEYLDFVVDGLRSPDNPEQLPKQFSTYVPPDYDNPTIH